MTLKQIEQLKDRLEIVNALEAIDRGEQNWFALAGGGFSATAMKNGDLIFIKVVNRDKKGNIIEEASHSVPLRAAIGEFFYYKGC